MAQIRTAYLLDTHPLVYWLFEPKQLTQQVCDLLSYEGNQIHIPTMAILELQYLIEIGRIDSSIQDVMADINETSHFSITPFDVSVLSKSLIIEGTRDPFDRIILATAQAFDWPVITKDRWMKKQLAGRAIW